MPMYRVRAALAAMTAGPGVSTFFFDTTGGTAQQAADAVSDFYDSIKGFMVNYGTATIESAVYTVDPATGQATNVTGVTGAVITGTVGTEGLPGATQGLLSLHTGVFVSGREIRGRLFIPGPTEANSDATVPNGAYKLGVDSAAAALIADGNSDWVIWSREKGQFATITSAATWNRWAVLRSRRD